MVSSRNAASLRAGVIRTYVSAWVASLPRGAEASCCDSLSISRRPLMRVGQFRNLGKDILKCGHGNILFAQIGKKRIDGLQVAQALGGADGTKGLDRIGRALILQN